MALVLNGDKGIEYANLNLDIKNLLIPKNWIINGMFDVWQRGTSQTTSGYGSDDRFNNVFSGSSVTHSRQPFTVGQTEVPNNPTYFSRTVVSSVAGASNYAFKSQRIEDVTKLAGKTIAISFWAKADTNKNMAISFEQNLGIGGSSTVTTIGVQKFALTALWQKFTKIVTLPSVSGKTIGSGSNIHAIFWFDAGSSLNAYTDSLGNQSGTFDIANVSLVEGSVAVECRNQPYADVLRECQRYYVRFGGNSVGIGTFGKAFGTTTLFIPIVNPVKMRTTPVVSDFSNLEVLDPNVNSFAITNAVIASFSNDYVSAINFTTTGLSSGAMYIVRGTSSSGYLGLNAEL